MNGRLVFAVIIMLVITPYPIFVIAKAVGAQRSGDAPGPPPVEAYECVDCETVAPFGATNCRECTERLEHRPIDGYPTLTCPSDHISVRLKSDECKRCWKPLTYRPRRPRRR